MAKQDADLFYLSVPKSGNASSKFFIERIGLRDNAAVSPTLGRKNLQISHKRHRHHSRIKSRIQDGQEEKRQFDARYLLPRPFDASSVKGTFFAVYFHK